jgi:hypothetical protein
MNLRKFAYCLALNSEPEGIIKAYEFAAAPFSIWLGNNPINEAFNEQILRLK